MKAKPASYYVGKKFGMLRVNKIVGRDANGAATVDVTCDCGKTKVVRLSNLKLGSTKTCGNHPHGKGKKLIFPEKVAPEKVAAEVKSDPKLKIICFYQLTVISHPPMTEDEIYDILSKEIRQWQHRRSSQA
jgi:hypothetical protein